MNHFPPSSCGSQTADERAQIVTFPTERGDDSRTIDFRWAPDSVWTLICFPDDPWKSLVREDGALLYDYNAAAFDEWRFDRIIEFGVQTTHRPERVTQWTESARRAIVHTRIEYPSQTLELVAFADGEPGMRSDVVQWRVTLHDDAAESLVGVTIDSSLVGATLATTARSGPHHVVHPAPNQPWPSTPVWTDDLPFAEAGNAAWSLRSHGHALVGRSARGFRAISGLMTEPVLLRAGESVSGAIVIALDTPEPVGAQPADDPAFADGRLEAQRAYWDALDLGPLLPVVPDAGVQDMLVACARNIMQARELEHGLPVLQVGPTIYRGLWLVDGHFMLETARYLGWDDIADAGLDVMFRRVRSDGSIIQLESEPHLKETAVAVSTIVRQAELTGNVERLRRHWPTVQRALAYLRSLREEAQALDPAHPFHGLVPPGFGDGGVGGLRAEYTTVAWILIGLRYAADGAAMLGFDAESESIGAEFASLRDAFLARAAEHRVSSDVDGGYLPMVAPGGGSHQFSAEIPDGLVPRWRAMQPETATWAMCQAIWPGEVFDAGSGVVHDMLHLLSSRDREEGIPATTGWLPWQAVWTYAASFAAHAWLFTGQPGKAIDYLYAFANHASTTRVWREEQPLAGTGNIQICGDMPHNWASAEFIRLVRHLVLFERGDELEVMVGAPAEWWNGALHLPPSPTRFGRVGLTVGRRGNTTTLDISRATAAGADDVAIGIALPPGAIGITVSQPGATSTTVDESGRLRVMLGATAELRITFSVT